ncbi:hypothetical protein [Abyssibacter sp.]|jgi:hypothetical protein|uniref:hypothetical protein n=2 Tax=Abyssibacter sp. TaxID=2320200 RepID=UPI003516589A
MKADMSSQYLCRLFQYMDDKGLGVITPRDHGNHRLDENLLGQLTAGYIQRAEHLLPRQGKAKPWIVRNNYAEDKQMMLRTPIADSALEEVPKKLAAPNQGRPAGKLADAA